MLAWMELAALLAFRDEDEDDEVDVEGVLETDDDGMMLSFGFWAFKPCWV